MSTTTVRAKMVEAPPQSAGTGIPATFGSSVVPGLSRRSGRRNGRAVAATEPATMIRATKRARLAMMLARFRNEARRAKTIPAARATMMA